jgi:hypothetical protein
MKTTDWKFDFSALPHWDDREKYPWVYDEYYEIPQSDTLCCLYAITEVSMMNYQGYLAILRNKENPELVLNVADGFSFCVNFSASDDGNLIFLQPSIYDRDSGRCHRPVLILDIGNRRFSWLKTANCCPVYKIVQKKAHVFAVEADEQQRKGIKQLAALHGRKIRTRWLRWYGVEKLSALPQML